MHSSVTMIGRSNSAMLVLLDLSAAFDNLVLIIYFVFLRNYVGMYVIRSYFSNRTQRVQIENDLSAFAHNLLRLDIHNLSVI